MRDTDPKADACTHRSFALFDNGGDRLAILRFDFAAIDEHTDELFNRFPAIVRAQIFDYLLFLEDVAQIHLDNSEQRIRRPCRAFQVGIQETGK